MAAGPQVPQQKNRPLRRSRRLSHYSGLRVLLPTLVWRGDVYVGDLDRHGIGSDINSRGQHGIRGGSNHRALDFELAFAGWDAMEAGRVTDEARARAVAVVNNAIDLGTGITDILFD